LKVYSGYVSKFTKLWPAFFDIMLRVSITIQAPYSSEPLQVFHLVRKDLSQSLLRLYIVTK